MSDQTPESASITHSKVAVAYDELAERWLDSSFPADHGMAFLEKAISFLKIRGGAALNVGCGCNTRFDEKLRAQGLELAGVDISQRMVELARSADPKAAVHHADICEWEPVGEYSFIFAWDSLWHVSLGRQRPVLLKLMSALRPGGVFLFTAGGTNGPDEHWNSDMGPRLYYASMGIPAVLETLDAGRCVCRHLEFDQPPEKHVIIIAQRTS
jgi:predicted TPR repeat methyltransferase